LLQPSLPERERGPGADDVSGALARLLASDAFDAAPRSRQFLAYVVQETLAGRTRELSQAAIARRVFQRPQGFDPAVDPIVRIQASASVARSSATIWAPALVTPCASTCRGAAMLRSCGGPDQPS